MYIIETSLNRQTKINGNSKLKKVQTLKGKRKNDQMLKFKLIVVGIVEILGIVKVELDVISGYSPYSMK
jgi:hypothetical protein